MEVDIWYEGDLSTRAVYRDTGVEILTDAPKENHGFGRYFSPTDLLAVALGSCMLTLMGLVARRSNLDIRGTQLKVIKSMRSIPTRSIEALEISIFCPHTFSQQLQEDLIRAAEECPVRRSLHPDIRCSMTFNWENP